MGTMRFFADSMLGRTARWLRLMGFDVEYAPSDMDDDEIIDLCTDRNMFLITRDRELSVRYSNSMYVPSDNHIKQLEQFLSRFKADTSLYFTRCPLCNGHIDRIPISEFNGEVPDGVKKHFDTLYVCSVCGKVYWEGSHFKSILATLKELNPEETQ